MKRMPDQSSAATGKAPGWRDLPIGGLILEPGNASQYPTGDWRSNRPEFNPEACINCLLCWVYCPDSSILLEGTQVVGIDYDHCKGCGICVEECPRSGEALRLVAEQGQESAQAVSTK